MTYPSPHFPTSLHHAVSEIILSFFGHLPEVDSILLLNSCARGKATPQSDLDAAVLLAPTVSPPQRDHLAARWHEFLHSDATIAAFRQSSPFTQVHLDLIDGRYTPAIWDDGGGPDDFELEIGNHLAYSFPLIPPGPHFSTLQDIWLPYYAQVLRQQRLSMVRDACLYDLDFVPFYVGRSLPFQAFDRLYKAFREFMQLLFIAHARYPIAYNKWIFEQVVDMLELSELYPTLVSILSISHLENTSLVDKAQDLRQLVEMWS